MNRLFYILIFVLAVFTSCHKQSMPDVPENSENSQIMSVTVKSDAQDPKFTFLFWNKEDFDSGLASDTEIAIPYHVANPLGEIGSYEEDAVPDSDLTDYNTGRIYPENYGIAVCTGYGPYSEVTPAENRSGTIDYTTLDVAAPGYTDVLVSQNYLEGSSLFPFSGNLYYCHPQIQLTVIAKLAPTMAKYIRNVSFTVGGANLMKSLKWDDDKKMYMPFASYDRTWTSEVMELFLNSTDERNIGTVLTIPRLDRSNSLMESIDLVISGYIGNTDRDGAPFSTSITADFTEAVVGGGLALGDSYVLRLLFDEDQIEVTVSKIPWEEGGNILIPIHPIPQE